MKQLSAELAKHLGWHGHSCSSAGINEDRSIEEYRQRLLTQYYVVNGAGGIAVAAQLDTKRYCKAPK